MLMPLPILTCLFFSDDVDDEDESGSLYLTAEHADDGNPHLPFKHAAVEAV